MLPVDFAGTNITLTKPPSMTDEQCSSIKAYQDIDNDGFHFFLIALQPSKEDIDAINSGRPIFIKICGDGFPPMAAYTLDDEGNANV